MYPELFPDYSCETAGKSTKCKVNVDKLRDFLSMVSTQAERDDWADVGDKDARGFLVTGITHDLLPVRRDTVTHSLTDALAH